MIMLWSLTKRNIQLYFKDKMTFFMSLISPLILLLLFTLFLRNVYIDSVRGIIGDTITVSASFFSGFAASWIVSSILSVSTVTIAFCSATLVVDDKLTKAIHDLEITRISKRMIQFSYVLSTFFVTMLVSFLFLIIGCVYIVCSGGMLTFLSIILLLCNTVLIAFIASILATLITFRIRSQGGLSALATLVSSMYGFICGAYMPLSQYPEVMRLLLCINPGLYASQLYRNLLMGDLIEAQNLPLPLEEAVKNGFDLHVLWGDYSVTSENDFLILLLTALLLAGIFLLTQRKKHKKQ